MPVTARPPGGGARFLLFHRERRWNAAQGVWMGWERKRGKLHELNALLRGSTDTSILVTGRPSSMPPERRALRHHARLRHATASRRRRASRGHDGAPAQPPGVRRPRRQGRGRPRDPAAAGHDDAAGRARGLHLPARLLGHPRASTPTRPRSPTSTRTSSARAPTPARASTTSTSSSRRWPIGSPRTRC